MSTQIQLLMAISREVNFPCQSIDPDLVDWIAEFLTKEGIDSLEVGHGKEWFTVSLSDCGRIAIIEELPPSLPIIPFVEIKGE
jgi:hypothetical protein